MPQYFFTILLLLSGSISRLVAQSFDEKDFLLYTTKNGLSSDILTGISQDEHGFIWVSTVDKLYRYNGSAFKPFNYQSIGHTSPRNHGAHKKLSKDKVAIINSNGVLIISSSGFLKLTVPAGKNLDFNYYSNRCFDAEIDSNGNYVVSSHNGLYIFNNEGKIIQRYDRNKASENPKLWFRFGWQLYRLPNGNILQHNAKGFFIYDRKNNRIETDTSSTSALQYLHQEGVKKSNKFFQLNDDRIILFKKEENSISIIDLEKNTIKDLGVNFSIKEIINVESLVKQADDSSIYIFSGIPGLFTVVFNEKRDSALLKGISFQNIFCNGVIIDKEKRIWITTISGLYKQNITKKIFSEETILTPPYLKNEWFSILDIKKAGEKLFLATSGGILIMEQSTKKIIRAIDLSVIDKDCNTVEGMFLKHSDTIWATTRKGMIWINTRNYDFDRIKVDSIPELSTNGLKFLSFDNTQNLLIWFYGTMNLVVYKASSNTFQRIAYHKSHEDLKWGYPNSSVRTKDNETWLGGANLLNFDLNTNRFDSIIRYIPGKSSPIILSIVERDAYDNIWVSSIYDGVYNFSKDGFTQSPALSRLSKQGNYFQLIGKTDSCIIFNFSAGICFMKTKGHDYVLLTEEDGLSKPFEGGFFEDKENGTFYFYEKDRLFWSTDNVINIKYAPPSVYITDVEILKDTIINFPPSNLTLDHKQNDIRVSFDAVNFLDPGNMRFSYRIKNRKDSTWIECTQERSFLLTNISPGHYQFEIRVESIDNKWPEQIIKIEINIRPPFWKTGWFILVAILIILTGLYVFYRSRVKNMRKKINIDKQFAELEMKGLHAQMNPHFIFNSLNSIKEMILEDEKQNASRYLSKFAQLIRTNLEQSRQTFISVNQCIDHLRQYLEMEKIRFDGFSYSIIADNELAIDEIQMAPMLIQPLVENAIWHGLQNKDGEKKLAIRFSSSGEQLICEIEDNGIGINQSKKNRSSLRPAHRSLGVTNIHERLVVLNEKYKMNCSLTITDRSELPGHNESGTLAILRLSIKNNL